MGGFVGAVSGRGLIVMSLRMGAVCALYVCDAGERHVRCDELGRKSICDS